MISPIMFYCFTALAVTSRTTNDTLQKIQNRADRMTNRGDNTTSITDLRNLKIVVEVFKSLQSIEPVYLSFDRISHQRNTRGNKSLLRLPRMRTESGKKSMAFRGAKLFNQLPKELREENSLANFKRKIKCFKFDNYN